MFRPLIQEWRDEAKELEEQADSQTSMSLKLESYAEAKALLKCARDLEELIKAASSS